MRDRKRKAEVLFTLDTESLRDSIKKKTSRLKLQKQLQTEQLAQELLQLEQARKQEHLSIHDRKDIELKIKQRTLERQFWMHDKPYEEFVESVAPLMNVNASSPLVTQQRQILYVNLFHKEKSVPSFIDHDVCLVCKCDLVTNSTESTVVCMSCGSSENEVFCSSDFMDTPEVKSSGYERGPLYKKYLNQFRDDAPVPPPDVVEIVHRNLSRVHMMLSSKVKATPIAQILRNEKLQKWVPFSVRIARFINNEPSVTLSPELIERLVSRFEKLTRAFTSNKQRRGKKIMNFEFLTKQFLQMEKEPDLAAWFSCHKTRTVLKQADMRLMQCSHKLRQEDSAAWVVTRSC